jgi:hypothetical protein
MNIQGVVHTQTMGKTVAGFCICDKPVAAYQGEAGIFCCRCGKRVPTFLFQAGESHHHDELMDIRIAKENIRNTLTLQKKRKKNRAGELDFLLKRL